MIEPTSVDRPGPPLSTRGSWVGSGGDLRRPVTAVEVAEAALTALVVAGVLTAGVLL